MNIENRYSRVTDTSIFYTRMLTVHIRIL